MTGRASLLAGPRGRRVCLALAPDQAAERARAEDLELTHAAFFAAYDLDPGRGTSTRLFGPGASEPVPRPSPAEVAGLLDAVELTPPDADALLRALGAAVDSAMYWQEPDGDDVLAATPEVRTALARVHALVAASPHAGWWSEPLDRADQWRVTIPQRRDSSAVPAHGAAARALRRWRADTVEAETTAARERPRDPRARWSGAWWSTPPHELTSTTRGLGARGPAGLWFVEDSLGPDRATTARLAVPAGARIHENDGPDAWAELCRRHPLEVSASRRHDWYRATGRDERWVVPDWSALAADIDAVHLTVAGYLTTAGRAIAVDEDRFSVLAGWNPDQTYWLTDVVVEGDEQAWTRDDDDWART